MYFSSLKRNHIGKSLGLSFLLGTWAKFLNSSYKKNYRKQKKEAKNKTKKLLQKTVDGDKDGGNDHFLLLLLLL